jgi:hypothetical protein
MRGDEESMTDKGILAQTFEFFIRNLRRKINVLSQVPADISRISMEVWIRAVLARPSASPER